MVSQPELRKIALSFPEATEEPHFEKTSFRVKGKIFATMDEQSTIVCLLLSIPDQATFCGADAVAVYPVPNKWGLKGATFADLTKIELTLLQDALTTAYIKAAPKRLAAPYIAKRNDAYNELL